MGIIKSYRGKHVYGLYGYGRKRRGKGKPKFLGFTLASNSDKALSKARKCREAKNVIVLRAKPYKELGTVRRFQYGFGTYCKHVAKGAL